jgi:hypothetical protein
MCTQGNKEGGEHMNKAEEMTLQRLVEVAKQLPQGELEKVLMYGEGFLAGKEKAEKAG